MADLPLPVEPLTAATFAPYGAMLGVPCGARDVPRFSNPATDFWHQHFFDAKGGQPEVLWVNYRRSDRRISVLEVHHLTQQAIVPLGGAGVLHVVACSNAQGLPDTATLRAFEILPGQGVCMNPGCWHATQVVSGEVSCLMLTRASTTVDLIGHMAHGAELRESGLTTLSQTYMLVG